MNEMLEDRVRQRTIELENKNKRLSEYAFINSHMLRAPVSRILGLINLIKNSNINISLQETEELIGLLGKSTDELDNIVKKNCFRAE